MKEVEFLVPEFEHRPKGFLWHLAFGLAAIGSGGLAWMLKNYTFIGLIGVIWVAVIIRQVKKPELISFHIADGKISLGKKVWDFEEIKSFSIFEVDGRISLILAPTGRFHVTAKIPITNPAPIVEKLNNYVPQVEYEESLLDLAARKLNI